jgi:hypothetical protein
MARFASFIVRPDELGPNQARPKPAHVGIVIKNYNVAQLKLLRGHPTGNFITADGIATQFGSFSYYTRRHAPTAQQVFQLGHREVKAPGTGHDNHGSSFICDVVERRDAIGVCLARYRTPFHHSLAIDEHAVEV